MSILGINGSPRPNGNTATLIHEVLAGAAEAGATTQLFQLGQMNVSPCIDCAACRPTAECVLQDDNQQFYATVAEAAAPKAMVIGTPIYLDHISAQLKTWIDRLHAYNYTALGKHMFPEGFKVVLVATYGAPKPDQYDAVIDWLAGVIENLRYGAVVDRIVLSTASRNPVAVPAKLLSRARAAGRRLVTG